MRYYMSSLNLLNELACCRPLVCFGCGGELQRLIGYCRDALPIKGVVDNSPVKQGTMIVWGDEHIPVYSLEYAHNKIKTKDWLITVNGKHFMQVIKQLSLLSDSDEFNIYWAHTFLPNELSMIKHIFPSKLHLSKCPCIPKIIHYAWFGNNPIPEEHQNYIAGWKKLCKDYEFVCWNESNYDVSKNKYMYQAYKAGKWGFVPDYLRKDVIYEYGGIYLDTDVEMIRPLDDLLYQNGFCGFEGNRVNFGLGFGAAPRLPIMREMRDAYDNMSFEFKPREKMIIGPDYETRQLEQHGLKLTGEYQSVAGLTVYPNEVLSGTVPYTGESIVTPITYTVHHYAGSWDESVSRKQRNVIEKLCKAMLTEESFDMNSYIEAL